ncbi:SUZ domain-containing protein 1 [Grifola frondosa]|uniref:SUZ RNA-binding domain-containing n=1 Tax=Grifola frondosa TaxID=5627 RepID=A0A1C7LPP2_GRIFR|nr:SUZ domain-containing protein 1 [Grifola frondosa]
MSITSTAGTSTPADPWDDAFPAPISSRRAAPVQTVPDDWDDDEPEEDVMVEDAQRVWEDANKKAPMPELVISGSSTTTTVSPPPAAFQPALRILKRPNAATATSSSSFTPSSDAQKSYAEREAQYHAARERIFNSSQTGSQKDDPNIRVTLSGEATPHSGPSAKIVRQPRGPDGATATKTGSDTDSKGFAGRRSVNKPT